MPSDTCLHLLPFVSGEQWRINDVDIFLFQEQGKGRIRMWRHSVTPCLPMCSRVAPLTPPAMGINDTCSYFQVGLLSFSCGPALILCIQACCTLQRSLHRTRVYILNTSSSKPSTTAIPSPTVSSSPSLYFMWMTEAACLAASLPAAAVVLEFGIVTVGLEGDTSSARAF